MPQQIDQSQAAAHLSQNALGVCEDHTLPEGRAFAYMLMREGHVKALFLEEDIDTVKTRIFLKRATLTEQAHNWPEGTVHRDDPLDPLDRRSRLAHQIVLGSVVGPEQNEGPKNPVPLWKLVAYAKTRKIPVFLIDSKGLKARSPKIMNARDKYAADRFKQIVAEKTQLKGSRAGCLLLFGQMHFQGPKRGGKKGLDNYNSHGVCLADHLDLDYVIVDKNRPFNQT